MRARSYSNRALAVASGMLWAGIPQPTSAARAADDQFQVQICVSTVGMDGLGSCHGESGFPIKTITNQI
jgi:hypothetical protein